MADDPVILEGATTRVPLSELVSGGKGELVWRVEGPEDWIVAVEGDSLSLTPQPGFMGEAEVVVEVEDRCGNTDAASLIVLTEGAAGGCPVTLRYASSAAGVNVAGSFNDFDPEATAMVLGEDGVFTADLVLAPGAYPYKFVSRGSLGDAQWGCDPEAEFVQCDAGYIEPWETSWSQDCTPGVESCNSMLVVEDCRLPKLESTVVQVNREAGTAQIAVALSGAAATATSASLDGAPLQGTWDEAGFTASLSGLSVGRHEVRVEAEGAAGAATPVVIPFWVDDFDWRSGVVYFAFIDRVANGDTSLDGSEGASSPPGAYRGGDFKGLTEMLPYLDDLGVTVLWISNPQDNAEGAWAGDCGQDFAGYHAYWPDDPYGLEEHFGDEAALAALVDAAHARGMRVIMDWVANHVHDTHPWFAEHPEWFNGQASCLDSVDGQLNFDRIPETCWFAPYLPDFDYSQPEVLDLMVRDAVDWAKRTRVDGFRADAVKHMPHSVVYNFRHALDRELEHRQAGGDELFWTIGETFDGADRIKAYVGTDALVGQFDFPLYYALRGTFAYQQGSMNDLFGAIAFSETNYGPDAIMSNFLGNHDVPRFSTEAAGQGRGVCENGELLVAPQVTSADVHRRLRMAWSVLFTLPAPPLVYYGDEFGLAGYADPDNRQAMWDVVGELGQGQVKSVDAMAGRLAAEPALTVKHVGVLARARAEHRAFWDGETVNWWQEQDVLGYARVAEDGDQVLVLINRSGEARTLENGLAFAGLSGGARFEDLLTGASFQANGDRLSVDLPAQSSRVLVRR